MGKFRQRDDWEIHVLFKLCSFVYLYYIYKHCMVVFNNKSYLKIIQRQTSKSILIDKAKHFIRIQQ